MFSELDFERLAAIVSILASFGALASSAFLWLARLKREQPNVGLELVSELQGEFVVPQHFTEQYQAVLPGEGEGLVCLWADAAAINNSILANAILQIDAEVRLASGGWQRCLVELRESTLPQNLDAQSTVRLALQLATKLPYDNSRTSNRERVEQVTEQLSSGREIRLSIRAVNQQEFSSILASPKSITIPDSKVRPRRAA
ncbi:MAG: hypothetical protein AB8B50_19220 [Pirellulaceae bacterium]